MSVKALLFDWGDTLMRDFALPGPMCRWEHVEAMPYVHEAMEELSKKYKLAVATNGSESGSAEVGAALARVGLDGYFAKIYAQKDLGMGKPQKRFFDHIARDLGLQPSEICMTGDNPEKDVKGALAAGMKAVLFDPENRHKEPGLPKASDMRELPRMIEQAARLP